MLPCDPSCPGIIVPPPLSERSLHTADRIRASACPVESFSRFIRLAKLAERINGVHLICETSYPPTEPPDRPLAELVTEETMRALVFREHAVCPKRNGTQIR